MRCPECGNPYGPPVPSLLRERRFWVALAGGVVVALAWGLLLLG